MSISSSQIYRDPYVLLGKINNDCALINQKIVECPSHDSLIYFVHFTNKVLLKCAEKLNPYYNTKKLSHLKTICFELIEREENKIKSYKPSCLRRVLSLCICILNRDINKSKLLKAKLIILKNNLDNFEKRIQKTHVNLSIRSVSFNKEAQLRFYVINTHLRTSPVPIRLKTRDISTKESLHFVQNIEKINLNNLKDKIENGYILNCDDIFNLFNELLFLKINELIKDKHHNDLINKMGISLTEEIKFLLDQKLNDALDRIENRILNPQESYNLLIKEFIKELVPLIQEKREFYINSIDVQQFTNKEYEDALRFCEEGTQFLLTILVLNLKELNKAIFCCFKRAKLKLK